MANNCYNQIQFFGNAKVKAQIKKWKEELDSFEPTKDDPYCARAIKEIFYPNIAADKWPDYGTKWVYQDDGSIDAGEYELGLRSAWGNPKELEKHLACLLYKLDKNIVVRNYYNIDDGSEGVSYSASEDGENAYYQEAFVECDYSEYEETEEAQEEVYWRLREAEEDMLVDYFLDDMPHLAKVLKKHMPDMTLDWSDYE